jgi:hypothetical protein
VEARDRGILQVLLQYLCAGTGRNHERPQNSLRSGRDSNDPYKIYEHYRNTTTLSEKLLHTFQLTV